MPTTLTELAINIHSANRKKGFYDNPPSPLEIHALITTEVAEATEAVRKGLPELYQLYEPHHDEDYIMEVELTGGVVQVDQRDFERVAHLGWYVSGAPDERKSMKANTGGTTVHYHNIVCNPPPGFMVDHIDGDSLNNIRSNLRVCTASQNQANQRMQGRSKSSQYKGVTFSKSGNKWVAQIGFQGKRMAIGRYDTEREAALAYDQRAIELFGSFARPNILRLENIPIRVLPGDFRWNPAGKIEGEAVEIIDVIIRCFDYCGHKGWDVDELIREKLAYNLKRPYKHGKKM